MAHLLEINKRGQYDIAYQGSKPWHGLGQKLDPTATVDQWRTAAGLDWEALTAPVQFPTSKGLESFGGRTVIYRSDDHRPLGVVSDKYKLVQPAQVMDFFRDLVETQEGWTLETAGCIQGGKKIWALANMGLDFEAVPNDPVKGYALISTATDGTLATAVRFTSIRVVCNNTMTAALSYTKNKVSVRHNSVFDIEAVRHAAGLLPQSFVAYREMVKTLATTKLSQAQVEQVIHKVFEVDPSIKNSTENSWGVQAVKKLYAGLGVGANIDGVSGTSWGLLNAFTEYVDFGTQAKTKDGALASAWFGRGANLKTTALNTLLELA